ncbi:hypothetical protein HMPREF1984_01150, partial [Leptotrichia sp. oral taxon 215 str. W9775]
HCKILNNSKIWLCTAPPILCPTFWSQYTFTLFFKFSFGTSFFIFQIYFISSI